MKISIIVPVYNGHSFIVRCLDSIIKQNIVDMEIIVVNDGSTDDSQEIIEGFIKQNKEFNIELINKKNAGLPQARKTGVEHSSGDFIGFVDVDDWIEPNMYKSMLAEAEKSNSDIVCCAFQMDFTNKSVMIQHEIEENTVMTGDKAIEYLHRRKAIYPYAWNKIYRKELICNISFPEGNFVGEDYTIVIPMLKKAQRVSVISEIGNHYIQVENSMCRGGYNSSYTISLENYMKISSELVQQYPTYSKSIHNYMIIEYMSMIVAMGKNKKYNMDMIRKIQRYIRKYFRAFITDRDVPLVMKGSAVAISLYWRILPSVYNFIAHIAGNYIDNG